MTEYPRFVDQFDHLIHQGYEEVGLTTHAKLVKIQNINNNMFIGILMDRSIAIPFTANPDTDESIKNIVILNNMDLSKKNDVSHAEAACKLLGLNFNGENSGFYSDGTALKHSNIMILHIYPKNHIYNQEEFIQNVSVMFQKRGCTITIEETP